MVYGRVRHAYEQVGAQANIHPVKLVHMMYERAILHLKHAEEGISEKNPKKRGENLSKAIAIISELNTSIKSDDESEAAGFLRGLYHAILLELPKVSANEDVTILQRSCSYIERLKEIWEQTAMKENGFVPNGNQREKELQNRKDEQSGDNMEKPQRVQGLSVSV